MWGSLSPWLPFPRCWETCGLDNLIASACKRGLFGWASRPWIQDNLAFWKSPIFTDFSALLIMRSIFSDIWLRPTRWVSWAFGASKIYAKFSFVLLWDEYNPQINLLHSCGKSSITIQIKWNFRRRISVTRFFGGCCRHRLFLAKSRINEFRNVPLFWKGTHWFRLRSDLMTTNRQSWTFQKPSPRHRYQNK